MTGKGHPLKHRVLDMASGLMQPKYPLAAMSTYLNGFHMYADEMGRQVEASHFCIHLQHDLHQCVIFDRNAPDARLIGIEYIVSEQRFRNLPEDEKRLWHSHHYEVKSGMLVAPGIPDIAEKAYFADLVTTYGKTFHTWQYDRDDFPYGVPQLMMALTETTRRMRSSSATATADSGCPRNRSGKAGRTSRCRTWCWAPTRGSPAGRYRLTWPKWTSSARRTSRPRCRQ
ncbi:MAG: OBAP family protein [Pseudonocardia sp.]|nr:OBAP family protein [Pseudonocardia sp.]